MSAKHAGAKLALVQGFDPLFDVFRHAGRGLQKAYHSELYVRRDCGEKADYPSFASCNL